MRRQKSLTTLLWVSMTFLFTVLSCLMMYLWINEELGNSRKRITKLRDNYIAGQRDLIKTQVRQAVEYVKHKRSLAEKRVRREVKSRTNEAHATATYIYQKHKDLLPSDQIKKLIHDALFAATWDNGKGYYFAESMKGIELINRNNPGLEGLSVMEFRDSRGKYIMKEFIKIAQSPEREGFCSYYYNIPQYPDSSVPKISYIKYFEPYAWVIGNGKYVVDEEETIKQEVLERIEDMKYAPEGYIFAGTWEGLSLSGPFKGENMLHITDPNGTKIVQELINASKSGGGFVEYIVPRFKDQAPASKISYAEAIPEWRWYIGTGLHVDEIETVIALRKANIQKSIRSLIYKSVLSITLFIVISFSLFWIFSRRIKQNLDLFDDFFKQSAKKALPIAKEKVFYTEFQSLADAANQMADERIKSEQALRDSEKKYRQLYHNAPAGIYEIDFTTDRFRNVNEVMCSFTGYTESELLQMDPKELFSRESRESYEKRLNDLFNGYGETRDIEVEMVQKDGSRRAVFLACDYIYEEEQLSSARVVAHDITALKRATEEKLNAQKIAGEQKKLALVGQIAGKMAHDFNNVLGIIMGNAQLLLVESKEKTTRDRLDLIYRQTLRGRNLTRNLIAFAKDQEPKQAYFNLGEKVDLIINLMRKDVEGIRLTRSDAPNVPDLLADSGMIEHALVNLLQNAIHAVSKKEDPWISLKIRSNADNIFFEIEDNGCGIPEEHLENIFEPSFTLKGSKDDYDAYDSDIKGTGYGMANVKKYVSLHNGSIDVASKFGKGTKITITLPIIKKELTDQEKIELHLAALQSGKYILLVEDEPEIADIQYAIMTQPPCNHRVDTANNGQVAKDLLARNTYDLISLDYLLPGKLNGLDLYHHIRETDQTVPILFISGNIEFLESVKELKTNDNYIDHLSKPCPNKEYIGAINELLGRHP